MKSFRLLLPALLFFSSFSLFAQDIIVQPNTASRGQRLQVLFSGVNVDFNQATNTQLYFSQGSNTLILPEVFHVQGSYLATGTYEIPVNAQCGIYDLYSYSRMYPDKLTIDCSAQIAGTVYFDANGNGGRDGNESGLEGITVVIQPATSNEFYTVTDVNGNYSALTSLGNYTVSIQVPQYHLLSSGTGTHNVSLSPGNTVSGNNDFGIRFDGNHNDLEVSLASTQAIAGFTTTYWVNCHNHGTTSQSSTVSVQLDANLSYLYASVPPVSSTGGLLVWNSILLQPGESVNIAVEATVAVVLPNTLLTLSAQISAATDETPANNADTLLQNVLSSYDPNDKLVEPAGVSAEKWTLKDQYLTYTIRFQNTGNFQAFNIKLTDTLDQNLDYSTLDVISSSHPVEYELKARLLNFYFNNILLPDSGSDLAGSNGYVQYRIKPKTALANNVVIENEADIFFDFNPAVRTNTTQNKMVDVIPTGIAGPGLPADGFFKVYPNPVEKGNDLILDIDNSMKLSSIDFISIYTSDGKLIHRMNNIKQHRFAITELANYHGVAILQVQSGDKTYYSKVVKF